MGCTDGVPRMFLEPPARDASKDVAESRRELDAIKAAASVVCAALDDAGRLHATTGGPELAALIGEAGRFQRIGP